MALPGNVKHVKTSLRINDNVLHTIGNTPLIKLNKIPKQHGVKCEILAKCEYCNPSGSLKDRIALRMIENAEANGSLKPGYVCIVPTSGNTGISMALSAAIKGYRCIIVMTEKMSKEKERVIKALGSEIVRTPVAAGSFGKDGIFETIDLLKKKYPNNTVLNQYTDPGNPDSHYDTTAEEILQQCEGRVDMLVIGTGTGGALSGIAKKLKEAIPSITIVGVDPLGSVLAQPDSLNDTESSFFEVEGIGHDFVPKVLDRSMADYWIKTDDKSSLLMCRDLIKEEGLLCGTSSGAVMCASIEAAKKLDENKRVVVLFGDGIRNYMTKFMSDEWMMVRNFIPCPNPDKLPWWDKNISCIISNDSFQVSKYLNIGEVLDYMKKYNIQEAPILKGGKIEGVVKKEDALSAILNQKVCLTDKISEVASFDFQKVYLTATLGLATTVLRSEKFLVVLENKNTNRFLGIITLDHIYEFVNANRNT